MRVDGIVQRPFTKAPRPQEHFAVVAWSRRVSRSMPALYKNKEHLCEVWEENGVGKVKGKKRRLSESAVYTYEYGHCCAMLWLGQDKHDVAAWLLARLFG